jgi:hypothetical protein
MMKFRALVLAAAVAMLASAPLTLAAGADDAFPGSQVLAKSTGDAVVIWDASPLIAKMVAENASYEKATATVEAMAGKLLVARAKTLTDAAKTLTVKVIYARTGAVSPVYKNATFTGIERLLSVSANREDAVSKSAAWLKVLDGDKLPEGITAHVTGKLPLPA